MNRLSKASVFWLVAAWAHCPSFGAKSKSIDLNNGVVFPSQGFSVFENPAVLPNAKKAKVFSLAASADSDPVVVGSFSGSLGKSVGIGVGFERLLDTVSITPGVGFLASKTIGLGLATTFVPGQSFSNQFKIGFRAQGKKGPSFALVAHDAFNFNTWSLGLGLGQGKKVFGEFDVQLTRTSGFDISAMSSSLSLTFVPDKAFSFLVRYYLSLIPFGSFSGQNLELAMNFWLSKKFALFAHYQNPRSTYLLGLQLAF